MGYIFEWDSRKASSNLIKHGVSFDEATTVFGDPLSLLMGDPKHSDDEQFSSHGTLCTAPPACSCFCGTPPRTRIISARIATRHERNLYEHK